MHGIFGDFAASGLAGQVGLDRGDGGVQRVEWGQLIVGLGETPVQAAPTWVGSACSSDADCTFEHRGTPGQCLREGARGFCTLPCAGFCPDREGFATTFCVASDFGSGACHTVPDPSNRLCADVPGTARAVRDRFIGASSAPSSSREVCAP